MEGAGMFALAGLLVFGVPYALLKLLFGVPYGLLTRYNNHFAKLGPREGALAEASHGAAMIVLPVLVLLRLGRYLPPSWSAWAALAALAVMICGGFRLFNGAKFSVGWRDPKLIARAALKIVFAVMLFRAIDARQFGDIDPLFYALLSLVGWWLLVTGLTKLLLVLRGLPGQVFTDPGGQYGQAGFWKPKGPTQ